MLPVGPLAQCKLGTVGPVALGGVPGRAFLPKHRRQEQGRCLAVHEPTAAVDQTCPCSLVSPRSCWGQELATRSAGLPMCAPRPPGLPPHPLERDGLTPLAPEERTDSKLSSRKLPGRPTRLIFLTVFWAECPETQNTVLLLAKAATEAGMELEEARGF